jgi:hypothetical protein
MKQNNLRLGDSLSKAVALLVVALGIIVFPIIIYYEIKLEQCDDKVNLQFSLINPAAIEAKKNPFLDSLDPTQLKLGIKEMLKHKLVVVGITRDNGIDLPLVMKYIEHIGGFFKDYRVILFENDSKDGTKIALKAWQFNNAKIKIISQDFNNKKRPTHKFMAEIRNNYLKELDSSEYDNFDMVMVLDMDMRSIDERGVQHSFFKIDEWDAVCSNGIKNDGRMYDTFAYRDKNFPWSTKEWQMICTKNDGENRWKKTCEKGKEFSKGFFHDLLAFRVGWQKNDRLYWLRIMPQIQKIYPVNAPLVPVNSCFGGMALYKRKFIKGCSYDSKENSCEHISFHDCMREKNHGRMFLNPAQITIYNLDW